jgi:hypothetical protein
MCGANGDVRFVPIADIQEFGSHKKKNSGHCPGLYSIIEFHTGGRPTNPLFFIGRQMVLGFFLGLELQRLLVGYQFLKSFKVLSVYESIKILLVREPLHVGPPDSFRGWAHVRVKSN